MAAAPKTVDGSHLSGVPPDVVPPLLVPLVAPEPVELPVLDPAAALEPVGKMPAVVPLETVVLRQHPALPVVTEMHTAIPDTSAHGLEASPPAISHQLSTGRTVRQSRPTLIIVGSRHAEPSRSTAPDQRRLRST